MCRSSSVSSPTHLCRWTAPPSCCTAQWAGCSSPPCPPAGPCRRKPPRTGLTVQPTSLGPGTPGAVGEEVNEKKESIKAIIPGKYRKSCLSNELLNNKRLWFCFPEQHLPTAVENTQFPKLTQSQVCQFYSSGLCSPKTVMEIPINLVAWVLRRH